MVLNAKIYVLVFIILCSCKASMNEEASVREVRISISFNDFFMSDTISLEVNGCLILKDVVVSSDGILGYTGITVDLSKNDFYENRGKRVELFCKANISTVNNLKVYLNGVEKSYRIDLRKGRYIGFDKHKGETYLDQLQYPFEYM
jgi:hypothetical protein